jgi:hypothetical protein
MASLSQRLEQTLQSAIKNNPILPVKTADGILVGDIKIVSDGTIKHLIRANETVYSNIYLNAVAICLANILARRKIDIRADAVYRADQEYGKWYEDSQMLRARYQQAVNSQDHDRADIMWARYCESRDRAILAKNHAQSLATI